MHLSALYSKHPVLQARRKATLVQMFAARQFARGILQAPAGLPQGSIAGHTR
jgi:hypothetical protein